MRISPLVFCSTLLIALATPGKSLFAATLASDNAADPVYNAANGGWTTGDNGGTGFGAWTLASSSGGNYIGATGQDPTSSFGLFAFGTDTTSFSTADRAFNGGALTTGQTFSLDLGHTTLVNASSAIGLNLLNGTTVVFTAKTVFGLSNWQLNDGGTDFGVGQASADNTSYHFTFTYNGGNNYSYTLGTAAGLNFNASSTISNITGFRLFDTAQGGSQNAGYNNLAVAPEPSTYALLVVGCGLLVVLQRRRCS